MASSRLFEIVHTKRNSSVSIEWQRGKSLNWFILKIRESYHLDEELSFVLLDNDGVVVLSASLMPGKYQLKELESTDSVQGIASLKVTW